MSGPSVHQHAFPKKRFQAAVVAAIDQHAAAIGQLAERVDAQGGVMADLAVDRDAAKQALAQLQAVGTIWTRLRWLFTGQ